MSNIYIENFLFQSRVSYSKTIKIPILIRIQLFNHFWSAISNFKILLWYFDSTPAKKLKILLFIKIQKLKIFGASISIFYILFSDFDSKT